MAPILLVVMDGAKFSPHRNPHKTIVIILRTPLTC